MKERLENGMRSTDDPLLAGPIERPMEVFVNKSSCVNPDSNNLEDYEYDIAPCL